MLDEMKYEKLVEVNGRLEADLIESYLEAAGIDVELVQEAIGHSVYPVMIDGLGLVQVFVPKSKFQEARALLKAYREELTQDPEDDESL